MMSTEASLHDYYLAMYVEQNNQSNILKTQIRRAGERKQQGGQQAWEDAIGEQLEKCENFNNYCTQSSSTRAVTTFAL